MNQALTVRKMNHSDTSYWIQLWEKYLDFYQTNLTKEVTNNTLNTLLSGNKDITCLVVCNDHDIPIGFLTYVVHFSTWKINSVCYLHDLYVENNYRKTGAATLLVNKLKEVGTTEKWERIYWITKPSNKTARIFYDKIAEGED